MPDMVKNWHELSLEVQRDHFYQAKEDLEHEISDRPELSDLGKHVEMQVNTSGLVIELR